MQNQIEQTLSSLEVAEMINKNHTDLMRDIRRYVKQLNQSNIAFVDFFIEDTYTDKKGEERPCYKITKKGCEFVACKLTGIKGTEFTVKYIDHFHEMEDIILDKTEVQLLENRELAGSRIVGTAEQEMYKNGIEQIITLTNDIGALRKIYTFAKYVPKKI